MKAWRIAVGSTRLPKVNAVREAVSLFAPMLDPGADFDVNGYEVESGVSHTPTSRAELMQGARQRAEALARSEERRVGKECRIGCRSRWSPYH